MSKHINVILYFYMYIYVSYIYICDFTWIYDDGGSFLDEPFRYKTQLASKHLLC